MQNEALIKLKVLFFLEQKLISIKERQQVLEKLRIDISDIEKHIVFHYQQKTKEDYDNR